MSYTGVTLTHTDTSKRHRSTLVNDAYPLAEDPPIPAIVGVVLPVNELNGFTFDDDDMHNKKPTVSCTTEQRSMIKLMKLLDDMESPRLCSCVNH